MKRHRRQWESLGGSDPYWAVLSEPDKKGGRWDREAFFETGRREIYRVLSEIKALGLSLHRKTALDYGCGVGRLSRPLSTVFDRVLAIDIAESMLSEAREVNADRANIEFIRGTGTDLSGIGDETVDFVYSNIVLQHAPRSVQKGLVREFCRVLAPGGVLVFQTPSRPDLSSLAGYAFLLPNRLLNLIRRLRYGADSVMEVHTLPRETVQTLLRDQGINLMEAKRDNAAGRGLRSYRYFATKPPRQAPA